MTFGKVEGHSESHEVTQAGRHRLYKAWIEDWEQCVEPDLGGDLKTAFYHVMDYYKECDQLFSISGGMRTKKKERERTKENGIKLQ